MGNLIKKRFCVYTSLFGEYEELNEQSVANESGVDFVCFTDNPDLTSETWKIINKKPLLPFDPARSSRVVKICPHRFLSEYDVSLYIDNSVKLKVKPEVIFEELYTATHDMILFQHSFRETVLDEYDEVLRVDYDKPNVVFEQLNAYSLISRDIFAQKPFWGGFLIRQHNKEKVLQAMEDWLVQVTYLSKRDQLSLNYVINRHDLTVKGLPYDNHETEYHQWPTVKRNRSTIYKKQLFNSIQNNMRVETLRSKLKDLEMENQQLSTELAEIQTERDQFEQEVLFYAQSKSWRITRPLRKLVDLIQGKKRG